jgi:DivIVA domain-containing protein
VIGGYNETEVDNLLDSLADQLEGTAEETNMNPQDLRQREFNRAVRGYSEAEVDDLLGRLAGQLERLAAQKGASQRPSDRPEGAEAPLLAAPNSGAQAAPSESPNRSTYEASVINWDAINTLALEVATNTKTPPATEEVESAVIKYRTVRRGLRKVQEAYTEVENKVVTTDRWELATRRWFKECQPTKYLACENESERTAYCLRQDGELFVRHEGYTEMVAAGSYQYSVIKRRPTERELTADDVVLLDFEREYESHQFADYEVRTDRNPSDVLLVSRRGEGLMALLRKLL